MMHTILHYGEIALKGRNRSLFEDILRNQILLQCSKIGPCRIQKLPSRFLLKFAVTPPLEELKKQLGKVFGLANYIPVAQSEPTLEELRKNLASSLEKLKFASFAVRAKRCEPNFPFSSQFINEEIGRFVQEKTGAKVDLDNPETTIWIYLFQNHIFYGFEKIPALGGMPAGMSGKVAALLSGGIDSPVAAWKMMKRGCNVLFIHFHSAPFVKEESLDNVLELAEVLNEFQ